jgi:PAS domain S-box-containing protein
MTSDRGSDRVVQVRDVTLSPDDPATTRREKLARIILDELYEFVGLLDADGRILEINRAALEGAGIRLDDIAGQPFWDARWWAVSRESRLDSQEMVRRASTGEFVRRDVEVFGSAEGNRTIIVDYSLTPIRDSEGRVAFLLPEGRNITDKKRAEAELARRTEELQQLLDRVRELDGARSNFYANVSHELRTPLSLILGPVEELLRDESLGERHRQHLDVVRRNALTLLKQVNALLDLAKIDAAEMELNYVRFDLGELVRTTAAHFDALAAQRGITFIVEAPTGLQADVDPDKYERMVLNLLSNAFKFTPDSGWIRCRVEATGAGRVLLSVQDSGPGVDPELRTEIFDRFHTGRAGGGESGGTGLGLAIIKQFAELHGGTVTLMDASAGGALFQVELPQSAPPTAYVRVADVAPVSHGTDGDRHVSAMWHHTSVGVFGGAGTSTVVVVEDHADMRRFIVEALRDEWRVIAVADAERALDVIVTEEPDLVVTDLMMPGISGEELVASIRAHASLAQVPILVLSARADDELRLQLLTSAVQDYVTKPFAAQELRARVRNLVTTKRARDALQAELATQTGDLSVLTEQLIAGRRELQATNDALRRSEERWRAVYENSAAGIALLDQRGRIMEVNPSLASMLERPGDTLRGMSVVDLCAADDRVRMVADLSRLDRLEEGGRRLQRRLVRGDGTLLWIDASLSLAPATSDLEAMVVCVVEDVTERNEARVALARAQDELSRVTRATALGTLAASIAHEVNQPLAAISANANACLRWLTGEHRDEREAAAAAERIVRDAERASEVIGGIRRFVGRGGTTRAPGDIGAVVGDVLGLLGPFIDANGVVVDLRLARPLPTVEIDRVQIQQVVVNLVMNGIEAMLGRCEHPAVAIEALARRSTVELRVVDHGHGIDPGSHGDVFDPFFTTKEEGMGMGLAIASSIAEAHGGSLRIERTGPGGTTMLLVLPVAEQGS